ncbi:MAG: hypothetical protein ABWY01_01280 [Pseudoxanthomonas sp.]
MKTPVAMLFLLCLAGATLAQETPVAPTANASNRTPAPAAPVATGHAVTEDPTGRPVAVTSHLPAPQAHDYRAEFDAMDSNGDGGLSRGEADADKYLARAFATYDNDGNDSLSFEEARRWLED